MPPAPRVLRPCRARRGFTLVELLVVIGIIAVLAGLLLTVRSRASDKAAQTQCMNNLRQIGMAMTMYAQDNEQLFPFTSPLDQPERPADWLHWRDSGRGLQPEQAINNSALARYLRVKGTTLQAMFRCPSDDWDNHALNYAYSYSFNYLMSSDRGRTPEGALPRLTAISRPSEKCLVAEENERTINDGLWAPGNYTDAGRTSWTVQWDWLSIRHDTRRAEFDTPVVGTLPSQKKRGCVAFVDGHADFVGRGYAHDPKNLLPNNEGTGRLPPDPKP